MSDGSFRSVIELWPSREAMAGDLSTLGRPASAWMVSKWWQRNTIPPEWWEVVLKCRRVVDSGFTGSDFIRWVAPRMESAR